MASQRTMMAFRNFPAQTLLRPLRPTPRVPIIAQIRPQSQTTKLQPPQPPEQDQQILARQRLNRPLSPHLSIYKWEINMISSAMERNTGILLSGGLYAFGTLYLASGILGWDLSSASMAAAFGALPVAAKVAAKFAVAWPFTFHFFNGVRYTVAAAMVKTLGERVVIARIGWAMLGLSVLSAGGLAFI